MKYYEKIGTVCHYCGNPTIAPCCGETHQEMGYVEVDKNGNEIGTSVLFEPEIDWVESTLLK